MTMNWINDELVRLTEKSLERSLSVYSLAAGHPGHLRRGESRLLNLSSNDYLGLSGHAAIVAAMSESLLSEGAGSGASRLVTGNRAPYALLEQSLAQWQGKEAALVFANGYMANTGVIGALVSRRDVVFSDRLNHASIVDGITLSRAEHVRYRHNDPDHLTFLLNKHRDARRKLIVTDAMFSMDGDHALLRELVVLKQRHGAMLMVDEAHSGGVYFARGEGLSHQLGVNEDVDVHMGTFSKSFGVYGAYVCGSRTLIRWLLNTARPLVYSTALPPAVIAGISKALELVQEEPWRRERLAALTKRFRASLCTAGFTVIDGDSPIIPLIVGDNETAVRFSSDLQDEGIAAVAIRPPTVPNGTARIRYSISALHMEQELMEAAARIRRIGLKLGVLKS